MTADEVLKKHEDDNEYHFHEVDRKWIIAAMEEYAALRQPHISGIGKHLCHTSDCSLSSDGFLKRLFQNNSDCYADTWIEDDLSKKMIEGEVIQAMTVEKFIEVVKPITSGRMLAICFAKWLQHLDNGTTHYNPFTKEKTESIGFSPYDCLIDEVYTIEELYDKWQSLAK